MGVQRLPSRQIIFRCSVGNELGNVRHSQSALVFVGDNAYKIREAKNVSIASFELKECFAVLPPSFNATEKA